MFHFKIMLGILYRDVKQILSSVYRFLRILRCWVQFLYQYMSLVFFVLWMASSLWMKMWTGRENAGFVINIRILPFTMISLVSSEIIENFNLFFVYYRSQGVVYLQA